MVSAQGSLDLLSRSETARLLAPSENGLHELLRRCSLAVLNTGAETDNTKEILETFSDFDIHLVQNDWGLQLNLENAPAHAFVNGELIKGIREHLFSVVRDIVYVDDMMKREGREAKEPETATAEWVFRILRNAGVLNSRDRPNLAICWGGHSIGREEYEYTRKVGYEMGLRGLDICTGCGPGAMKGPMKGALVGHYKQRIFNGKFIGLTEPGIIAAEPPNPVVSRLVILPDIEKRLEAFIRMGHAIIVFPGGPGSMEEILYLLGILLSPENHDVHVPLVFTGPESSRPYFQMVHDFIGATLGFEAQQLYKIIIGDAQLVGAEVKKQMTNVKHSRKTLGDSYFFNWHLSIPEEFTRPFEPMHNNMSSLEIRKDMPVSLLASNLRKAFSGIVAGNIKSEGISAIEKQGPYELNGDPEIMAHLDTLLLSFVEQHRMKLPGSRYVPCYRIV